MRKIILSMACVLACAWSAAAQTTPTVTRTNKPPAKQDPVLAEKMRKSATKGPVGFQPRVFPTKGDVPYEVQAFVLAKQPGQYLIETRVTLVDKDAGAAGRRIVGSPRIQASLGQEATLSQKSDKPDGESVVVSLKMPENAQGNASFKVVVTQGDKTTGEAEFKLPLTARALTDEPKEGK